MTLLHEELTHFASRLRTPTPENIAEDVELFHRGILDHASLLSGYQYHNHPVEVTVHDKDGNLRFVRRSHNLRTNAGGDWQANLMEGLVAATAAIYLGLSSDTATPTVTDIALGDGTLGGSGTGEYNTFGMSRVAATPVHGAISGTGITTIGGSYSLAATWVASASVTNVQKCGVFTAITGGTMVFENTFTPVSLNATDTMNLTYYVNF